LCSLAIAVTVLSLNAAAVAGDTYYVGEKQGAILLTNIPSEPDLQVLNPPPGRIPVGRGAGTYGALIREVALAVGLREELLAAVIAVESDFRPSAVSPKGAMGLMQLMPETASALGVSRPFDPRENVFGGARHLRDLLDRFEGDVELALAAYNAGERRVRNQGAVPAIPETRHYIDQVFRRLGPSFRRKAAPVKSSGRPAGVPDQGGSLFVYVDENGITNFTDVPAAGLPANR
jgi:soluble lytic murein transglycosylase-like protein